jgi:hypothetical protein
MQSLIIPKKPSASLSASAAIIAAFAAFAITGCGKDDSPTGPASDAKIVISSPSAGQVYNVGDSLRVNWTVKDDPAEPIDGVNVSLSPDGGITWGGIASKSIGPLAKEWGKFSWKITDSLYIQLQAKNVLLKGCTQCKVKVEQYSTQDPLKIVTTATFSIK